MLIFFIRFSTLIIIKSVFFLILEDFLSKAESELITFVSKTLGELWRPTKENCNFPFLLILELLEHFIPIGTTRIRSGFQTRDEVSFFLINEK